MPYFDFHCHPGLKPTFSDQSSAPSVWDFISAKLVIFKNVELSVNPLFNEVLNSQSNLAQLYNGNVKMFGIALHSPEAAMAEGLLQKKLVIKGALPLIDHHRLELIRDGKHYYQFMNDDLRRLSGTHSPQQLHGAKLKVLKNASDFNEADDSQIHGFLVVEGLHCFFDDQFSDDARDVFERNFEQFTDENTVLAINVCHIQQNAFCNHAYGIQFISNKEFFPTGSGITNWGRQVIERMLEKGILVDVKHMSLWSRWQLYSMLRDPADPNKYRSPILCTHAGVTGISIRDRVKYLFHQPIDIGDIYEVTYLKPKSTYLKGVYYNCSSINLYDEDIEAILLSDGLIGLSFDQRILGFCDENVLRGVTTPHDVEYISEQEAGFFLGPNPQSLKVCSDDKIIWTADDFENLDPAFNQTLQPLFFINQVLHILTVARNNPAIGIQRALKKICLGTDYDGLINAVDNCKQIDKLDGFRDLMFAKLPGLLTEANLGNESIDVITFVDDLFYRNGRDFVVNRLQHTGKA